jgi:hypothetical protein
MNNLTLDQKAGVDTIAVVNTATKVHRKPHTAIADVSIMERLKDFTFSIPDFRRTGKGNHRHKLRDIIMLIILARMSKCISRADMIEFGNQNLRKFRSMNMLRNGVPSEPTLCRIENGIDSKELADRMAEFLKIFHDELADSCGHPEIINIDGKAMCGTVQGNGRNPDIVSAYSPSTGITLATEVCKEKSNEIKAVPLLLVIVGRKVGTSSSTVSMSGIPLIPVVNIFMLPYTIVRKGIGSSSSPLYLTPTWSSVPLTATTFPALTLVPNGTTAL